MPRRRDDETAQAVLVPMGDEELKAAGKKLARLLRELALMQESHATIRSEQKAEQEALREAISALAETIRTAGK